MIIDIIENWNIYFTKGSGLYPGIKFLTDQVDKNITDGQYEIQGDDIYATVQSYTTDAPENKKLESHRKYIDIQYIVSGREIIGWRPVQDLEIMIPYSEEKDVIFYRNPEFVSNFLLAPGFFAVFYPDDAHRPCCYIDKPEAVRKIVVKVKI